MSVEPSNALYFLFLYEMSSLFEHLFLICASLASREVARRSRDGRELPTSTEEYSMAVSGIIFQMITLFI